MGVDVNLVQPRQLYRGIIISGPGTALNLLCSKYYPDVASIQMLLQHKDTNPNQISATGCNAIHVLLQYSRNSLVCNSGIIEMLLEAGIDINAQELESGSTPLHLLACRLDIRPEWARPIAHLFMEKGADPRIRDSDGKTALELAKERNNVGVGRAIIAYSQKGAAVGSLKLPPDIANRLYPGAGFYYS